MSFWVLICYRDEELLESLVAEVEKGVEGVRVSVEGEDDEASSTTEASPIATEAKDQ